VLCGEHRDRWLLRGGLHLLPGGRLLPRWRLLSAGFLGLLRQQARLLPERFPQLLRRYAFVLRGRGPVLLGGDGRRVLPGV
jgi:hypothetical protein